MPAIISAFLSMVLILIAMAFYTLLERKILGYSQLRKGPTKVSIFGIPQPLADAVKLLAKEKSSPSSANYMIFLLSPLLSFVLALTLTSLLPIFTKSLLCKIPFLLFLFITSLSVYPLFLAGWASNAKYSMLGALRGVAQTISYEVSMVLIILSLLFMAKHLDFWHSSETSSFLAILMQPVIMFLWSFTILAEANRTPFDLAEGESELVSGFNTEYGGALFAIIFMAEYTSILMISMISAGLLCSSFSYSKLFNFLMMMVFTAWFFLFFLFTRASLPRIRYDMLMNFTWKSMLPISILLVQFYLFTSLL
nr:NADH dehydrogenase subunit 1 [Boudemos sp. DBUA0002419.01]